MKDNINVNKVKELFEKWNKKNGYKVINVKRKNGKIKVKKERFIMKDDEESEIKWYVKMKWKKKYEDNGEFEKKIKKEWIIKKEKSKMLKKINIKYEEWIILKNMEEG